MKWQGSLRVASSLNECKRDWDENGEGGKNHVSHIWNAICSEWELSSEGLNQCSSKNTKGSRYMEADFKIKENVLMSKDYINKSSWKLFMTQVFKQNSMLLCLQHCTEDQEVPSNSMKAVREEKTLLTSSTPMTPAPMTTIFSGTFFKDKAPVDDTIVSSSIYNKIYTIKIIWKNLLSYKLTPPKMLRHLFVLRYLWLLSIHSILSNPIKLLT